MISPESHNLRSSAIGALAGLVGSLCCLGPAAAVLLGLGSSSALWGLALGRGVALAIGGALLLAGLALVLRQARSCPRSAARWRAPLLLLAAFALSYGALGLLLPRLAARQAAVALAAVEQPGLDAMQVAQGTPAPQLRRATLIIEKMTCPPCVPKVQRLLARQPAIRHFVAVEGNEEVTIDYDPQQIDAQALVRLIPHSLHVSLLSDVVHS